MNSLNDEGVLIMAREVGVHVTNPVEGFVGGKRFVKVRLHVNTDKPVKEDVMLDYPTLGDLQIYCCDEKVSRLCRYCGLIGHDMASCPDHMRVSMILSNPSQEGRFNKSEVLAPKFGAWITNPAKLPLQDHDSMGRQNKSHVSQGPNVSVGCQNKRTSSQLRNQQPNTPAPPLSMQVVNVEVKHNHDYSSTKLNPPLLHSKSPSWRGTYRQHKIYENNIVELSG